MDLFSMFLQNNRKVRLSEEQLLPPTNGCPFCLSARILGVGYVQTDPPVELWECDECRVVAASRLPREDALVDYYARYYGGQASTTSYPESTANHVFSRIGRFFEPCGRPLKILDFGGGDGSIGVLLAQRFLQAGRAHQVEVDLVDYNAQERAVPPGILFRWHRQLPRGQVFDVVLASAILEHVPQARELLSSLLQSLEPGGLFYGRTPYTLPFHKILTRLGLPSPVPYPAHLYDMGRDYWDGVLAVLGWEGDFRLLISTTSLVEAKLFSRRWLVALISYLLKAPSCLPWLRDHYDFVGGWEAFIQRRASRPESPR